MSGRKPYVGGNWKMNLNRAEAAALAEKLAKQAGAACEVVVFPPLPYLESVGRALAGSAVKLGAQDAYPEPNGAYTGEVSLAMLQDLGVRVLLTGHSERRHVIGESDVLINAKTRAALRQGFEVILCVGEKIEQREAGQTDLINAGQLAYGISGVPAAELARLTLAYEPVWAIGTGKTATPGDAQAAHAALRRNLASFTSPAVAQAIRIQYGGSVKASNAAELFAQPDIDGGLIGGASLKAEEFLAIVHAASNNKPIPKA
jgi:triosephosphate isomerase